MTKAAPTATLLDNPGHWITLDWQGPPIEKETVSLDFVTEWRGDAVVVRVECDRYATGMDRANLRLTDWRAYATKPRHYDGEDRYRLGATCSETARDRVADVVVPLALAWLDSDAYTASAASAYAHAFKRELYELRASQNTDRVRDLYARYWQSLTPADRSAVLAACDAHDAFQAAYEGIAT